MIGILGFNKRDFFFSSLLIVMIISRGSLPPYAADIFLMLGTLIALGNLLHQPLHRNTRFMICWIHLYITVTLIGFFDAVEPKAIAVSIFYYLIALGIFFILKRLVDTPEAIFDFMQLYCFIVGLISLATLVSGVFFYLLRRASPLLYMRNNVARGAGLYGNPNYYAISVLIAVGFVMGIIRFGKKDEFSKWNRLLLIIFCLDILFTFSRGAWVSLGMMSLFFSLPLLSKEKVSAKTLAVFWILVICLLFFTLIYGHALKAAVFDSFAEFGRFVMRRLEDLLWGTGSGRYDIWLEGFEHFSSSWWSFIFGLGGNQSGYYSTLQQQPHNGYLKSLYENGILGFTLVMILIFRLLKTSFNVGILKVKSPLFFPLLGLCVMSLSNDVFILKEFWIVSSLVLIFDDLDVY